MLGNTYYEYLSLINDLSKWKLFFYGQTEKIQKLFARADVDNLAIIMQISQKLYNIYKFASNLLKYITNII